MNRQGVDMVYRAKSQPQESKRVDLMFRPEKLEKPETKSNKKKLWFKGIAATEAVDQQGEKILMDGLDLQYFLLHGWFADGHSKLAKDGLGKPTVAEIITTDDGRRALYVEGYLYDIPKNRELYDLMFAAEEAGDEGVIGFSVEGPVEERSFDGKTLKKAVVRNIAITRNPVNSETYIKSMKKSFDEMVKALDSGMTVGDPTLTYSEGGTATPLFKQSLLGVAGNCPANGGKKKMKVIKSDWDSMTDEMRKAMQDAATTAGVELAFVDEAPVVSDTQPVMEKSLGECTDEMLKALADVKETWEQGGYAVTWSAEAADKLNLAFEAQNSAISEMRDQMAKSFDVIANHNTMVKEQAERIAALESVVSDSMNKIMDALRVPAMAKSLDGTTSQFLAHPGENMGGDMVSRDEAASMIKKAFEDATSDGKREVLREMFNKVSFDGFKGTKAQLESAIATVK